MSVYVETARILVRDHYNEHIRIPGVEPLELEEVFCVWFCKTLQNWKALVSAAILDTRYYEVTYNGDKGEVYIDTYLKERNDVVSPPPLAKG